MTIDDFVANILLTVSVKKSQCQVI